ncbi:glutamine amidotransferase [Xylophilus sp. GW821-FHT01B05]
MDTPHPLPFLIIKLGDTLDALRSERGDFDCWIAEGLGATAVPVQVCDPRRGDALPAHASIAGAVVTGSHAMVTHRADWSERTAQWLAEGVARGTPLLGICYGHQLLAHALGGVVDDHPQGLEMGSVDIALHPAASDDPLFHGLPSHFRAHAVHRQTALRLPEGAVALASNSHEPHHAFRVGDCAWGVQFHPEFNADAMRGYIDALASDPAPLRAGVSDTPIAAGLLGRFARWAEARGFAP